ncbi:MAG: hypothetical protein E6Q97_37775 [Desulfurellales bacterium]|nr:MAG: hypothetical protein E6Q97_37775 [Desulfurellales bacterium]
MNVTMTTADRRRLYIRALAVVRLNQMRESLSTCADMNELDRAVLNHAEKMLVNAARKHNLIGVSGSLDDAKYLVKTIDEHGGVPAGVLRGFASLTPR